MYVYAYASCVAMYAMYMYACMNMSMSACIHACMHVYLCSTQIVFVKTITSKKPFTYS